MRKHIWKLLTAVLCVCLGMAIFAACGEKENPADTTYTVTYVGGEGATGTAPASETHKEGEKFGLAKNTFSKADSTFDKWSDGTNTYAAEAEYTMPAKNVTFTAQWKANTPTPTTYTITFTLGDGVTGTAPTVEAKAEGAKFNLPDLPAGITKEGHTFSGWNDGTKTYAAGAEYTMPAKAVTFTAQWTPNTPAPTPATTYTVTFSLGTDATGTPPTMDAQEEGAKFDLPALPTGASKTGYTFSGWSDGTKTYAAGDEYTMPAHNVTFTAQWTADAGTTITVSFYADEEASAALGTVTVAEGATIAASKYTEMQAKVTPEKDHRFVGWYYIADETPHDITDAFVPSEVDDAQHTVKLYAKTEFYLALGQTDNSQAGPGWTPTWTDTLHKGDKVVFKGTHDSDGLQNWDTVLMYLYSDPAVNGFFRADWFVSDSSNAGEGVTIAGIEKWTIVKAAGPTWGTDNATFRDLIQDSEVCLTFDWSRENMIELSFVFYKENASNADNLTFTGMRYTITSTETFPESYTIGLGCEKSHVVLTKCEKTTGVSIAADEISAENPLTIGNEENYFNSYPGLIPEWTGTIAQGEKYVFTGTQSSLALENHQSVFAYLYSTAPTGLFRIDNFVLEETAIESAEHWNIALTQSPVWKQEGDAGTFDYFRKTLNGNITVTFDWSDTSKIVITFDLDSTAGTNKMVYTITSTGTFAQSYNIGFACEGSHVVFTGCTKTPAAE